MDLFPFVYHTFATDYPTGYTVSMGNSYQYAAEPTAPDQRILKLQFATMFYYQASDGVSLDYTKNLALNMGALEQFYLVHRMWKNFNYQSPVYGLLVVRFNKPLSVPAGIIGGQGSVASFGVELIEQP